jgi:GntR family transcriptional regulator
MTLRQAYDGLEREQVVESYRGRGTFIAPPRIEKQQQEMRSFTEEIRSRGGVPRSAILSFKIGPADPEARHFFSISEQEQVYRIERVRYDRDVALALEIVRIPCYLCPKLDRFDLSRESLYDLLDSRYGLRLARCEEVISAAPPSRTEKTLLDLPRNVAVLIIERKTFTGNDTPVELARTAYRGDRYNAIVRSIRSESRR